MAEAFIVQMDEEDYRIVGPDGEEGCIVPYGIMATLTIDEAIYYCLVDDGNEENPVVYHVTGVKKLETETEDVAFPPEVIAAQRKLDAAIEATGAALDAEVEGIVDGGPEES